MWFGYAKVAKDIKCGDNAEEWSNMQLIDFIESKRFNCPEFSKAIRWIGNRNCKEVLVECQNKLWLEWFQNNKPRYHFVAEGTTVTITKGIQYEFAVWAQWILDTPIEYLTELRDGTAPQKIIDLEEALKRISS